MIKFLPSYVGSKAFWLKDLEEIRGDKIAELFCGSSVLSANLASESILNDLDPKIYKILSSYSELEDMESFTKEDYFEFRKKEDWWKYVFYFQKMSFSGVFRYSKNGYNVPIKPNIPFVKILPDLIEAKARMASLNPVVLNRSYIDIDLNSLKGWTVILDPPYQGSKASYNSSFNYREYWWFVEELKNYASKIVIFDRESNLLNNMKEAEGNLKLRKMRVNGKYDGDIEAMLIVRGVN